MSRRPPAPLTAEEFARQAGVSRETLDRLGRLVALLEKWQKRINLVGVASLRDVWRRHVWDSAQLLPLLPPGARTVADLGSGAGFPGLVLAILGAATVHLVESDARKCAFLREASRLAEAGAVIHHGRIENLPPLRADAIVARALAPLDKLLDLAVPHLAPDGVCLFLKGRSVPQELTDSKKRWNMLLDTLPSRTDPEGVILKIREVSRRHGEH